MLRIVDPQALRAGTQNWSQMVTSWIRMGDGSFYQRDELLCPHDPTLEILRRHASISFNLPFSLHGRGRWKCQTKQPGDTWARVRKPHRYSVVELSLLWSRSKWIGEEDRPISSSLTFLLTLTQRNVELYAPKVVPSILPFFEAIFLVPDKCWVLN